MTEENNVVGSERRTDLVYLLTPKPIGLVPSISPFTIKLESWLRLVDIPYEIAHSTKPSERTKQFPFVELNGEELCDTNLIIGRLSEHFHKPIDENLSPQHRAVSLAFMRMIEEHTFQAYIWYRYVHNPDDFWNCFNFPAQGPDVVKRYNFVAKMLKDNVTQKSFHHGIGRKTPEEIFTLAESDLMAISSYLSDKDFMMGDKASLIDCSLFGHFVQLFDIPFSFPPKLFAEKNCPNLVSLKTRMQHLLFSDWQERCNPVSKPVED